VVERSGKVATHDGGTETLGLRPPVCVFHTRLDYDGGLRRAALRSGRNASAVNLPRAARQASGDLHSIDGALSACGPGDGTTFCLAGSMRAMGDRTLIANCVRRGSTARHI